MARKRQIKIEKRFWYFLFMVAAFVFAIIEICAYNNRIKEQESRIAELMDSIQQTDAENLCLTQRIEDAGSDKDIEQRARDVLGWVKDGEILFTTGN